MMTALGGLGLHAPNLPELTSALEQAIAHATHGSGPALIDVSIDPLAGVESGNVHSFNAPKAKL